MRGGGGKTKGKKGGGPDGGGPKTGNRNTGGQVCEKCQKVGVVWLGEKKGKE